METERQQQQQPADNSGLHPLHQTLRHSTSSFLIIFFFKSPRAGGGGAAATGIQQKGSTNMGSSYEDTIVRISSFSTVEGFWRSYCHLTRPDALPRPTDIHLFRTGIRPLWEDAANRTGGKLIIRLRKGLAAHLWENLLLAFVGEQLDASESLCGVVVSIRYNEDILSIWNRSAAELANREELKESVRKALQLPAAYPIEYRAHDRALKATANAGSNSAYRGPGSWIRT
eukprot:TRINITY_DN5453_c0_g2_i1.p1 TRINITY_DN5453_c0_g2~~TRINITY_DN5453_c0_g2_i1.p1  ORF type:complete len:229 (-),score=65.04 TRINITY_DN5453_c0_g2_i1:305-991(-)